MRLARRAFCDVDDVVSGLDRHLEFLRSGKPLRRRDDLLDRRGVGNVDDRQVLAVVEERAQPPFDNLVRWRLGHRHRFCAGCAGSSSGPRIETSRPTRNTVVALVPAEVARSVGVMRGSEVLTRELLAVHEASHLVVGARLLGVDHVGCVTIEEHPPFAGSAEIIDLGAGEPAICVLLAGRQGELVAAATGLELELAADDPHQPLATVALTLAPLSIEDIAFVRGSDSPAAAKTAVADFPRACQFADQLVGEPDAFRLVGRLERETRALLHGELPALRRLAAALLQHGTLAAADVAELLTTDRREKAA